MTFDGQFQIGRTMEHITWFTLSECAAQIIGVDSDFVSLQHNNRNLDDPDEEFDLRDGDEIVVTWGSWIHPIFDAIGNGNLQAVKLWSNHKIPVDFRSETTEQTPLMYASRKGQAAMIRELLHLGPMPMRVQNTRKSVLIF